MNGRKQQHMTGARLVGMRASDIVEGQPAAPTVPVVIDAATRRWMTPARLERARKVVRSYSQGEHLATTFWSGVAASYLCSEMNIGYHKARALLQTLEAEGFIYDNGRGGMSPRYFMHTPGEPHEVDERSDRR